MSTSMTTEMLSVPNNTFYGVWWVRSLNLFLSTNGSSHIACSAYQNTAHIEQ